MSDHASTPCLTVAALKALPIAAAFMLSLPSHAAYAPPDPARMSSEAPVKGNLLRNSSFELGWHGIWGDTHQAHDRQVIDDHVAYHGRRSVRVQTDSARPLWLTSQFVRIKPFHHYTFSAYVKASVAGVPVEVAVRSGYVADDDANYAIRRAQQVGAEWTRVLVTGPFGETPGSACSVQVKVGPCERPAQVWVDALQLEEGDLSDYAPARPLEAALMTDRPADLFFDGEAPELRLKAVNYSNEPQRTEYRIRVTDFWSHELLRKPIAVELGPREEQSVGVALSPSLRGSLRVQTLRTAGDGLETEAAISVVPRPLREGLWPASTIGNHLGTNPYILKVGKMIGINWSRDHDSSNLAHWDVREPQPGRYVWADEEVDRIRGHGVCPLLCLEKVPSWQGKSEWSYPRSLAAWRRYVRKTVEHYRGRVDYYTVWNEGWGITGEQFGTLVREACKAAHGVDPEVKLVFEYSTWQGVGFLEPAKTAGAAEYTDIPATHLYTNNDWRLPDEPGTGWTLSYNIARLLNEFGDMAKGKPLWMTEGGLYHDAWRSDLILDAVDTPYARRGAKDAAAAPWMTAEDATRFIPRYYVTWRAGGGDKWFYYFSPYVPSQDNPSSFVFLECDGSLHPMGVANAVVAHELDGSAFVRTLDLGDIALKCHVFDQFGEGVAVLWWQGGGDRKLDLPRLEGGVRQVDMMGNEVQLAEAPRLSLTGDPVYLRRKGLSAEALAEMLQRG